MDPLGKASPLRFSTGMLSPVSVDLSKVPPGDGRHGEQIDALSAAQQRLDHGDVLGLRLAVRRPTATHAFMSMVTATNGNRGIVVMTPGGAIGRFSKG